MNRKCTFLDGGGNHLALLGVQFYISWRSLGDVTWRVEQCVRARGLTGAHIIPSLSFYLGAPAAMLASNAVMKKLNRTSVQNDLLCSNICLFFLFYRRHVGQTGISQRHILHQPLPG